MLKFFLYNFSLLRSHACHLVEKGSQRLSRLESLMIPCLTRLYHFFLLFFFYFYLKYVRAVWMRYRK